MKSEPLLTVAFITSAVAAAITLLTAFEVVALTNNQQSAIMGAVAILAPVIVGWVARRKVTPVATPPAVRPID